MKPEQIKRNLIERDKLLKELKNMSSQQIDLLLGEVKNEHQQIVYEESHEKDLDTKETWQHLAIKNEQQSTVINQYISIQYQRFAKGSSPKVPVALNASKAFIVGGSICLLGQLVINYFMTYQGLDFKTASGFGSVSVIVITGILTGFGIYDEIGRFGGAGSMVPISGFANSIVSAALEFKREGLVYGIGAKIFTIAGPVILYGTLTAVIIGLIKFLIG